MVKLALTIDKNSRNELLSRADRMSVDREPFALEPLEQSVHFLRGVNSRASFCLPAFHQLLAASSAKDQLKGNYPLAVSASYTEFSSLNTISLSCRKAFDHAARGLTGAKFAKTSDEVLKKHAEYWANGSGRGVEEARSVYVQKPLMIFFPLSSLYKKELGFLSNTLIVRLLICHLMFMKLICLI